MKSWNSVCRQWLSWAKKHRRLLALAIELVHSCALPSCTATAEKAGTAGSTTSRELSGKRGEVIHHAGHEFHRSYDERPRPVGGMDELRTRLEMPGEFYRDAGPGESGRVRVEVWIRADGKLQRVTLLHSDHRALDAAVVEALRGVTWLPAKKNGNPVGSVFRWPVTFRFADKPAAE